jgi:hypothetical protein
VGQCFEVYANFRRDGKAFDQFPDRQSFRIYLDELRRPEIRERLVSIWTDPLSLDPARKGVETAVGDSQRIAQLTTAVFTAAFEPVKKRIEAVQNAATPSSVRLAPAAG